MNGLEIVLRLDRRSMEVLHRSPCCVCPWIIYYHGQVQVSLDVKLLAPCALHSN
jgi:hypothetical protein